MRRYILHRIGVVYRHWTNVAAETVTIEDKDAAFFANLDQQVGIGPWLVRKHENTARTLVFVPDANVDWLKSVNASLMAKPPLDRSKRRMLSP